MKNAGFEWTPAMDARLLALKAEGMRYSAIAAEFGRTKNAICGRIKRLRDGMKPKAPRKAKPKTGAYHRNYGGLRPLQGVTENDKRMAIWRRQRRGARRALEQMGAQV